MKAAAAGTLPSLPLNVAVILFPDFELLDVATPGELLGADSTHFNMIYCSLSTGGDSTTNTSTRTPIPIASSCMDVPGKTGTQGPSWNATHRLVYQVDEEKMIDTNPATGSSSSRIISSTESIAMIAHYNSLETPRNWIVPDMLVIPGGKGVREQIHNARLKKWLFQAASQSTTKITFTVCTGSWLLATTGVLDHKRATSNKNALATQAPQLAAPNVDWVLSARWVEYIHPLSEDQHQLFLTSSGVSTGGDAALALITYVAEGETHHMPKILLVMPNGLGIVTR